MEKKRRIDLLLLSTTMTQKVRLMQVASIDAILKYKCILLQTIQEVLNY